MNPIAVRDAYRRAMDAQGEPVIVRSAPIANYTGPLPEGPSRARVMEYQSYEIVGGITAGTRKAIILHEDLASTPYPNGIIQGARFLWNGRTLTVTTVDNGTKRISGVPIAYICKVSGA